MKLRKQIEEILNNHEHYSLSVEGISTEEAVDQILDLIQTESKKCIHGDKCSECLTDLGREGLLPK